MRGITGEVSKVQLGMNYCRPYIYCFATQEYLL